MKSKKRIRLEDIARELNVSAVSVSNALRNKKGWGKISKQYQKYAGERAASLLPPSAGDRCYGGSEQRSGCLRGPGGVCGYGGHADFLHHRIRFDRLDQQSVSDGYF